MSAAKKALALMAVLVLLLPAAAGAELVEPIIPKPTKVPSEPTSLVEFITPVPHVTTPPHVTPPPSYPTYPGGVVCPPWWPVWPTMIPWPVGPVPTQRPSTGTVTSSLVPFTASCEKGSVRLRGGAGTHTALREELVYGDEVTVIGQTTGADNMVWYRVKTKKRTGYIRYDQLLPLSGTAQFPGCTPRYTGLCTGETNMPAVNVRLDHSVNATLIRQVASGTFLIMIGQTEDRRGTLWYYVCLPSGAIGYIRGDLVDILEGYLPGPGPDTGYVDDTDDTEAGPAYGDIFSDGPVGGTTYLTPPPESMLPTVTPVPEFTPMPTITPLPTITPVPTPTPMPTITPVPTPTPVPTISPAPTATPVPTITPEPTQTPMPTITPVPTPTPMPTITPVPVA